MLECGHCLTGSTKAVEFPCTNSGGDGSFMVLADAATSSEDTAGENTVRRERYVSRTCIAFYVQCIIIHMYNMHVHIHVHVRNVHVCTCT